MRNCLENVLALEDVIEGSLDCLHVSTLTQTNNEIVKRFDWNFLVRDASEFTSFRLQLICLIEFNFAKQTDDCVPLKSKRQQLVLDKMWDCQRLTFISSWKVLIRAASNANKLVTWEKISREDEVDFPMRDQVK